MKSQLTNKLSNRQPLGSLAATVALASVAWLSTSTAASAQVSGFFDWSYASPATPATTYPLNQYNRSPWMGEMTVLSAHISLMSRSAANLNASLPGALNTVTNLEYLLTDVEGGTAASRKTDLTTAVSRVRNHTNVNNRDAVIGNYEYFAGITDWSPAESWGTGNGNRGTGDADYRDTGMNVSMPNAYFYNYYQRHTDTYRWGTTRWGYSRLSPNAVAALFWAPLEHCSVAARNLPAGHYLIPWVSGYVHHSSTPATENPTQPTPASLYAMIQHLRMRKASSFHIWGGGGDMTNNPATSYATYRTGITDAWHTLDGYFGTKPTSYINLGDPNNNGDNEAKVSGLSWSGVRYGNSIKLLVSNLNTTAQTANIQTDANAQVPKTWFRGMPTTISQTASTHTLSTTYTIANLLADGPMTTAPPTYWSPWSAAAVYSTTGGSGNSSCYKLTGPAAGAATVAGEKIRVEPGAAMNVSVWAKSNTSGAKLMVNFYLLNSAGAVITTSGASTTVRAFPNGVLPTTTGGTLTNTAMPIPATAGSPAQVPYYIQPLLQNGSPSTVITVDDMVVKFE